MTTIERLTEALRPVMDPELGRSIVDLGMVRSVEIDEAGAVQVVVSLTTPGCPIRSHFEQGVTAALMGLDGVTSVRVGFDVLSAQEKQGLQERLGRPTLPEGSLAEVGSVLCIASGKGGVGKSTLTTNLAAALLREGKRVGVLDADVWGYSLPRMFGVNARPRVSPEGKILPLVACDEIKLMSIGFFLEEDSAVVWRGPMLHKAIQQFLEDVDWGALDYLLVDLPPGTGDVSMSLAQFLPQSRFVIVTTPQPVAQKVARRAARMAEKVEHEVAGVIENMSGFVAPSGERFEIFDSGGGEQLAGELGVPLLGTVPLTMPLRMHADSGTPLVLADPQDPAAEAIVEAARRIVALAPPTPRPLEPPAGVTGVPLPMAHA